MGNQRTFASMAWDGKGKVTRRERFLAEMDAVIPWPQLVRLIGPHYPKAGQGRQPLGLEKMLRIYFLQQWFNLSDPQAEDAIYDSESMRRFAQVELGDDVVPDETTILRFRHLLEQHGLTKEILRFRPCWKSAGCCCAREPSLTRPLLRRRVRPRTRPRL